MANKKKQEEHSVCIIDSIQTWSDVGRALNAATLPYACTAFTIGDGSTVIMFHDSLLGEDHLAELAKRPAVKMTLWQRIKFVFTG